MPVLRWWIIGLLSLGMIIAYVERANLSVALAVPEFKQVFGLSEADRGMLNSAFFWSYAFLQIPAGWLIDRYGVKYPVRDRLLRLELLSASTACATSVSQLLSGAISAGRQRVGGTARQHALDPVQFPREGTRTGGRSVHDRHQDRACDRRADDGVADRARTTGGSCLWFSVWDRFCG